MEAQKLIGEIIGTVAIIEGFFIFLSKKRENILIFKFISDVLWVANQLLIGGYTGAILNGIAMGREAVFYNRDRHKWASSPIWLAVFITLTLISPTISLLGGAEGWYSMLPAIGSVAAVIGFYGRNPDTMRYVSLVANSMWLFYNIIIHNISAAASSAVLLLSALVGTALALKEKSLKRKKP